MLGELPPAFGKSPRNIPVHLDREGWIVKRLFSGHEVPEAGQAAAARARRTALLTAEGRCRFVRVSPGAHYVTIKGSKGLLRKRIDIPAFSGGGHQVIPLDVSARGWDRPLSDELEGVPSR